MLALLAKLSRSHKTQTPAAPAAHRPAFEPLEGRRLCSVSPVAVSSFSWGETNTGLLLPAVQAAREAARTSPTGGTSITDGTSNTNNIIAILIGL